MLHRKIRSRVVLTIGLVSVLVAACSVYGPELVGGRASERTPSAVAGLDASVDERDAADPETPAGLVCPPCFDENGVPTGACDPSTPSPLIDGGTAP